MEFFDYLKAGSFRKVTTVKSGHVLEARVTNAEFERKHFVMKISKDKYIYVDRQTGEYEERSYKSASPSASRADNLGDLRRSISAFRRILWSNSSRPVAFLTLTYADNMRDVVRLYNDARVFVQKFCRAHRSCVGYALACEPQQRGAWHLHVLFYFSDRVPNFSNSSVRRLWRHGFTKTDLDVRKIRDVAAYLTSYLTDFKGKKGARLYLYPAGFHAFRWSRYLSKPVISRDDLCGDDFVNLYQTRLIAWKNETPSGFVLFGATAFFDLDYLLIDKKVNNLFRGKIDLGLDYREG